MFIKVEGYIINVNQIRYIETQEHQSKILIHLTDDIIPIYTTSNKVELIYGDITKQMYDGQLLTKII